MHNIIIEKPYQFVPPYDSKLWPRVLNACLRPVLKVRYGMVKVECRGAEKLKQSIAAKHGVMIAPNHSRPCDAHMMGVLANEVGHNFFIVASWHLFMQGPLLRFLLRRAGAFSIYREGMDKAALNASVEILENAQRPLVIFPEGVISRTNEHLNPLMEGTSFIARTAAKKRAKNSASAKVVVHPVALNYHFHGEIEKSAGPVLDTIEQRLSWKPQRGAPLIDRIYKTGEALLGLKEVDYIGRPQQGLLTERLKNLIEHILAPLEKEWRNGQRDDSTTARVKRLRQCMLPDMTGTEISEAERARRWKQLADMYLAQHLDFYPPDYVKSKPTPERILETVERFEEDLTDHARIHRPMSATIEVGDAIEVSPERDRGNPVDPVMQGIEEQLKTMLKKNARAV